MITNLNFDEIFDTSRLFEKTPKTDLDILTKSISELDTAFESLLSNFLLVPIKESEEIAKDTERNIENDYNKFFSIFKTTIKIMIDFFNKYEANGVYSDNGFSDFLKNTFNSSKDAYDAYMAKRKDDANAEEVECLYIDGANHGFMGKNKKIWNAAALAKVDEFLK